MESHTFVHCGCHIAVATGTDNRTTTVDQGEAQGKGNEATLRDATADELDENHSQTMSQPRKIVLMAPARPSTAMATVTSNRQRSE